jgi:hypothetical protein
VKINQSLNVWKLSRHELLSRSTVASVYKKKKKEIQNLLSVVVGYGNGYDCVCLRGYHEMKNSIRKFKVSSQQKHEVSSEWTRWFLSLMWNGLWFIVNWIVFPSQRIPTLIHCKKIYVRQTLFIYTLWSKFGSLIICRHLSVTFYFLTTHH